MLFKIEIPKRNGCCAGKGEKILPGAEFYSLVFTNEENEAIRQDYCLQCWPERREPQGCKLQGYWRAKVEPKSVSRVLPRFEQAFQLLKNYINQGCEEETFILTLFLSRAKKLYLRKEFHDEEGMWGLYENPKEEEFFKIKMLPLNQLETDRLQALLASKLST